MARMTSRAVGWLAGRIGGEKKRKGAMEWMDKTGLGQLLGYAGDAAIVGGALKGAGALKNLLAPSGGATTAATSIPTSLPTSLPSAVEGATPISQQVAGGIGGGVGGTSQMFTPSAASSRIRAMTTTAAPAVSAAPTPPKPGMMSSLLTTMRKPEVLSSVAGGVADVLGASQDRAAKQAEVRLKEQELRLERERQARLAQLLMPLFEQQIGRAGRTR